MSELIDREKAMNAVADIRNILEHMDSVNDSEIHRAKRAAERILAQLPAVDAVPVIRCEECKFSSPNRVYGCRIESFAGDLDERMYSHDFCSSAKRKDDE